MATFTSNGTPITGPSPQYDMPIISNNGVLKVNSQGQIYTDGTVETLGMIGGNLVEDTLSANIDATGTIVSSNFSAHIIRVTPGETYTCNELQVIGYFTAKPQIGSVSYDGSRTVTTDTTFTVPNDSSIKYAVFRNRAVPSYCVNGSVLYNGGTATAEMLLKYDTYTDEQEIIDGTVTRNVKAIVLDGTETWSTTTTYSNVYRAGIAVGKPSGGIAPICNYFAGYNSYSSMIENDYGILAASTATIAIKNKDCADVEAFKTWLADQYAAGTPVTVIYPLEQAVTEQVAPQVLNVQTGDNVLEITQASLSNLELEASYKKQP